MPGNHVEYYDYDIEGRLAQITNVNGGIETFGYDGDGNRLYRTIGTTTQTPADGSGNGAANGGSSGSGYDNGNNKDVATICICNYSFSPKGAGNAEVKK